MSAAAFVMPQGLSGPPLGAGDYVASDIYSADAGRRQAAPVASGEVKTPPFSAEARVEAGMLLRRLQEGERLGMPHSRPIPGIGARCHELRIVDAGKTWRIIYRLDPDAIVIAEVFQKAMQQTPVRIIQDCRRRLARYDATAGGD